MALNGKTVHERNFPSGWVGCIGPVPCFQQHGMEQTHFKHFSANSVDFHSVSRANAVLAHQHKPSKETDNEILKSDRKPGARESHHSRKVAWLPENDEKYQDDSERLHSK